MAKYTGADLDLKKALEVVLKVAYEHNETGAIELIQSELQAIEGRAEAAEDQATNESFLLLSEGDAQWDRFRQDVWDASEKLRARMAEPLVRNNGDVWLEHGHPDRPCSPPQAVRGEVACWIQQSVVGSSSATTESDRVDELMKALGVALQEAAEFKRAYEIETDMRTDLRVQFDSVEKDVAERIAQAIQAAKPFHPTRNYTDVDAAYDRAARIARGDTEHEPDSEDEIDEAQSETWNLEEDLGLSYKIHQETVQRYLDLKSELEATVTKWEETGLTSRTRELRDILAKPESTKYENLPCVPGENEETGEWACGVCGRPGEKDCDPVFHNHFPCSHSGKHIKLHSGGWECADCDYISPLDEDVEKSPAPTTVSVDVEELTAEDQLWNIVLLALLTPEFIIAAVKPRFVGELADVLEKERHRIMEETLVEAWEEAHAMFCPRGGGKLDGSHDVCSTHHRPGDRYMFSQIARDAGVSQWRTAAQAPYYWPSEAEADSNDTPSLSADSETN